MKFRAAIAALSLVALGLVATPASAAPASIAPAVKPAADKAPPPLLPDGSKAKNAARPAGVHDAVAVPRGGPHTKTKPPSPPQLAGAAKRTGATYKYAGASQTFSAAPKPDGVYANVRVEKPYLNTPDYHTLAEIALQSQSSAPRQIVEVGWTVDPVVNSGCSPSPACKSDPHLFVYLWVNENTTYSACYNGCGFVNYAGTPVPAGASVSSWVGTAKQMGIQFFAGDWWISVNGSWVGYYPGTLWTGATPSVTFNNAGIIQLFGETVVDTTGSQCSDMGSGSHGTLAALPAAYFASYSVLNGPAPVLSTYATDATKWSSTLAAGSVRTFYYGGPGAGGVKGGC